MAMSRDKKIAVWILACVVVPIVVVVGLAYLTNRHTYNPQEGKQLRYELISEASGLAKTQAEDFANAVCSYNNRVAAGILFDAGVEDMSKSDLTTLVTSAVESHCPNR